VSTLTGCTQTTIGKRPSQHRFKPATTSRYASLVGSKFLKDFGEAGIFEGKVVRDDGDSGLLVRAEYPLRGHFSPRSHIKGLV
jgi:hypothetical protein